MILNLTNLKKVLFFFLGIIELTLTMARKLFKSFKNLFSTNKDDKRNDLSGMKTMTMNDADVNDLSSCGLTPIIHEILPLEIVEKILKLLNYKNICQTLLVSRRWKEIIDLGNLLKKASGRTSTNSLLISF